MVKELSLFKWQEKATKLAFEDNSTRISEMQANISRQEENLKRERLLALNICCTNVYIL